MQPVNCQFLHTDPQFPPLNVHGASTGAMPAGRLDSIGEAARFAPSAGSVPVRFIGVEPGVGVRRYSRQRLGVAWLFASEFEEDSACNN